VTLSVAALTAFGPTPGIVKKLAEILDYGRLGRPDYRRYQAEAWVGECLMTWEHSIAFRKRAFVRLIFTMQFRLRCELPRTGLSTYAKAQEESTRSGR